MSTGFWDWTCCKVIFYLAWKDLSSATINWFGPRFSRGFSIFLYTKQFFSKKYCNLLLERSKSSRLFPPLAFLTFYMLFLIYWSPNYWKLVLPMSDLFFLNLTNPVIWCHVNFEKPWNMLKILTEHMNADRYQRQRWPFSLFQIFLTHSGKLL